MGKKKRFGNEETITISIRVPESKKEEYNKIVNNYVNIVYKNNSIDIIENYNKLLKLFEEEKLGYTNKITNDELEKIIKMKYV